MRTVRFALTALMTVAAVASADDFRLDWWTIDGGGVMNATGGEFELSGTISQPDAGVAMTGGDFELIGGFWAIAPMPPCAATAWRSVRTHPQGVGELAIALDPGASGAQVVSETRRGGVQKIVIDFDTDITSLRTGTVEAEDITHGGLTPASSQTVINNGSTLVLEFTGGLPDRACYRIDLAGHIAGLAGDSDCLVRGLCGDTNGDGVTDSQDMLQVRGVYGSDPTQPGNARFDVNLDGKIDLTDMALVKHMNGGSARLRTPRRTTNGE